MYLSLSLSLSFLHLGSKNMVASNFDLALLTTDYPLINHDNQTQSSPYPCPNRTLRDVLKSVISIEFQFLEMQSQNCMQKWSSLGICYQE
jgi:hypothetical protein